MSDATRWLSATELAEAYRTGALTPETVATELLDAIEDVDPPINAFCLVDRGRTMAAAVESTARFAAGTPIGPLDGVPVSIKDLLLTAGWPTLRGSLMIEPDQMVWDTDAPAVARLREAGAVLLGKVTTPEFGWKGVTDSPRTGVTRNPWDTTRTSGGSSGGSAAALAAGLGPLSVGTDGGGSIRIPAAYCGVVGFKPTMGRVPMYPPSPFAPVAHVGPMTRTVSDCAALLDVLSGFDARDWSALPPSSTSMATAVHEVRDLADLRVGYSADLGFGSNDPGVQANTDRVASVLEQLGATVEKVDLGWDDPAWAYHVIWFAGAGVVVRGLGPHAAERVDPLLIEALERHRDLSAADVVGATALRMEIGTQMSLLHQEFDVLLTPSMPTVAFGAGRTVPDGSASPDWTSWTPYTYPFNLTGQPAISVPSGFADGLPTGAQFVGARHHDATVLRVAAAYEAAAGFTMLGDRP
ncbi:amidase [Gordonia terrae]|uniref:amidase n=2 Tax=Gordonia terrae TaxID=2055 RepID=A0AAD0P0U0_9ACTN|nr:amidase [Gordonia terrae]VTR07802.1 aspartyl/glutamyl-tRNA amidotransferase subunit A [Clostridioides difficile]ANY24970.1 amidase [Gordonia terrae]AWO85719.1 amidase [Gordonia terrae]VTS61088.1 Glutamyl-tRNA(Gln) amidotransferase subunit A [Gordonia terrae]GAB44464.1 putative amidase [Gordonia terrae NBRC 100016]